MQPSVPSPTLLPVEIWLACWTLCSRRQLRRLSLVCQLFRSLTWPLLVQHQTIDVASLATRMTMDNWQDRLRHLHRTAVRLDNLNEASYALLVCSWTVTFKRHRNWGLPGVENMQPFDALNERVVSTFSTTLRLYQNISSLHLTQVTVDRSLRQTLSLLPRLEDLGLCNWDIVARDGFLNIQCLTLSGTGPTDTREPVQIGAPESLRSLDAGNYISGSITGFGLRILHQLVNLSLETVQEVDPFFRFLRQCPRLQSLAVRVLSNRVALPEVHPTTLPHLRTLAGPPKLHHLLAPGRAISSATALPDTSVSVATLQEELVNVCFAITRSSVPVHSLTLVPKEATNLEFLAAITALFPELKELSLTLPEPLKDLSFLCMCYGHRRPIPPVELEWPDLDDDTAFDNAPADDISDDEVDESPTILDVKAGKPETHQSDNTVPLPHNYVYDIFDWIFDGILSLPPNLEALRLETCGAHNDLPSLPQQQQVIAMLAPLFPGLREVELGSKSTNWKRFGMGSGQLWKAEGRKSWVRIG
ncbi:hypothetical protein K438DRAFT_1859644 [Mycena galopus ATCC 62051]|nr:hypothetical protein K438DRAFT_1859644 [Mycena galopus ATCC 62051]